MTSLTLAEQCAVLIVEDDALLLLDAMDMAEEAGLLAFGAYNADEALELLDAHSNIRILFTDVQMPGSMDGLKLAHAVKGRWPPVSIMVTSGVAKILSEDLPGDGLFFSKPYQSASIVKAMKAFASTVTG